MLKIAVVLCAVVAVVCARPQNYNYGAHTQMHWKNHLLVASTQQNNSECDTANHEYLGVTYKLRLCTSDDGAESPVCLATSVRPCCAEGIRSGNLLGEANLSVGEGSGTVRFYLTEIDTACYRLPDNFLTAKSCTFGCDLPDCARVTTACFENTETGDIDSCTDAVCRCKEGFRPPDCCNCDFDGDFYLTEDGQCLPFCRENCALIRDREDGCFSCAPGYVAPPECCKCDIQNNFFYDPVDGTCRQQCTNRTGIANFECSMDQSDTPCTCREGYTGAPGCCECDEGFVRVDGECKRQCTANIVDGRCKAGYLEPLCCECDASNGLVEINGVCRCPGNTNSDGTCKDGYDVETLCCECIDPLQPAPDGICKCLENTLASGECKPGFAGPDCCECEDEFEEQDGVCVCSANVLSSGGCKPGFLAPRCCECDSTPPGLTNINGECKCHQNIDENGNCKDGFSEESLCCLCEGDRVRFGDKCKCTTNVDETGQCINGFDEAFDCCKCKPDLIEIDGVCQPIPCDPVQDIYFLLDVSSSFSETLFCELNIGLQLLIAAINPSETSQTKIVGFLFGRHSDGPAQQLFNTETPCNEIVGNILPRVTQEMGEDSKCRDSTYPSNRNPLKNPSTREYPSVCKDGTYPLPGLEEIRDLANSDNDKTRKRAIVIFTDGVATGTDKQVSDLMKELENVGVATVIAAGIPDATEEDLRRFSSSNNLAVLGSTPVKLVRQVADKLQEDGILCKEQVEMIKTALSDATDNVVLYCYCVAGFCEPTHPTCGDSSLTFSGSKRNADIESNMKTELEEEILKAVEEVMKHLTDE